MDSEKRDGLGGNPGSVPAYGVQSLPEGVSLSQVGYQTDLASDASYGEGVSIDSFVSVGSGATIGVNAVLRYASTIDPGATVLPGETLPEYSRRTSSGETLPLAPLAARLNDDGSIPNDPSWNKLSTWIVEDEPLLIWDTDGRWIGYRWFDGSPSTIPVPPPE